MQSLVSEPGSRVYVHIGGKTSVKDAVERLVTTLTGRVVVVTVDGLPEIAGASVLRSFQIGQGTLDIILQQDVVLVIEAAESLKELQVPRNRGRIVVLGTDWKSWSEITEAVRFLSGPQVLLSSTLDVAKVLSQIGHQLSCPDQESCSELSFIYRGIPVTIPMTPTQFHEYQARLQYETGQGRREPYSALQVTNFLYPPALQIVHNVPRLQRPEVTPDLPENEGGWITVETIQHINTWSPKLHWLIRYLRSNPGHHVIRTIFNESNGAEVISTVLKLAGFDVITITGSDRQSDRSSKLQSFNNSTARELVLVTSLHPFDGWRNVLSVVLFEQHPTDSVLNSALRAVATGSVQNAVNTVFIISSGPSGEITIETTSYLTMSSLVRTRDSILEVLKTGTVNDLGKLQQAIGVLLSEQDVLRILKPFPVIYA